MFYKSTLGIAAIIVGLFGYWLYIRDIFRGRTRPHVFTWFVWSIMIGTAFFAQLSKGGGAGAWVAGTSAFICLFIAVCALRLGEKKITLLDWAFFAGSIGGLALWKLTANPLAAILVITVVDALAFVPTFIKSYSKPWDETSATFVANAAKYMLAIAALESYSLTTWLYPAYLIASNAVFVAMLYVRRRQLSRSHATAN